VVSPIKKIKLAAEMTDDGKSWGLVRMCKTAKLYKQLNKATTKSTVVVTEINRRRIHGIRKK
jgi:hypothetical protein